MLFKNAQHIKDALEGIIAIEGNELRVVDSDDLRERLIDRLVYNAVFHESEPLRQLLHWMIREAAVRLEIQPASMQRLFAAMATGAPADFTVPALNLHVLAYDLARACFRAAQDAAAGAYVFELSEGEDGAPFLDPLEYASCVLAAAIKEGHPGTVFLQADFLRLDSARFRESRADEVDRLTARIEAALAAGFFNLNLNTLGLVDGSRPSLPEQQAPSFVACAELAALIRALEPTQVDSSLGGAIAETYHRNETANALRAFVGGFLPEFRNRNTVEPGLSKVILHSRGQEPAAAVEPPVSVNIEVLKDLAEVARREYGLCVSVKAQYLPDELLAQLPANGTGEVKLTSDIETWVYGHEAFPENLRQEIRHWIDGQWAVEHRLGETDEQYQGRVIRQALQPFKQRLWDLPKETRDRIASDLRTRIETHLRALNVKDSSGLVRDTVDIERTSLPAPVSGDYHDVETTLKDIIEDKGPGVFTGSPQHL
jgi:hypothetical protein